MNLQCSNLTLQDDPFNPATWSEPQHEFRIYSGTSEDIYAIVDEIDYHEAIKYKWTHKTSRGGKKIYLKRSIEIQTGPTEYSETERYPNGRKKRVRRSRIQHALYLHIWIMQRKGDKPPTRKHVLVHHVDGAERNCRRNNLEWETHAGNSRKRVIR